MAGGYVSSIGTFSFLSCPCAFFSLNYSTSLLPFSLTSPSFLFCDNSLFPALLVSLRSELCHCSGYSDNFFSLQGSGLGCLMLSNLSQPPRKPIDNFRLWTIGHGFYFLRPTVKNPSLPDQKISQDAPPEGDKSTVELEQGNFLQRRPIDISEYVGEPLEILGVAPATAALPGCDIIISGSRWIPLRSRVESARPLPTYQTWS